MGNRSGEGWGPQRRQKGTAAEKESSGDRSPSPLRGSADKGRGEEVRIFPWRGRRRAPRHAHPYKPWTSHAGPLTWLPVPADGPSTISDVYTNLRVNTCGSIVGSQALRFTAGNDTVIEFNGFLWTKPDCDPAPPAIFTQPPGTVVTATTTIGSQ